MPGRRGSDGFAGQSAGALSKTTRRQLRVLPIPYCV